MEDNVKTFVVIPENQQSADPSLGTPREEPILVPNKLNAIYNISSNNFFSRNLGKNAYDTIILSELTTDAIDTAIITILFSGLYILLNQSIQGDRISNFYESVKS